MRRIAASLAAVLALALALAAAGCGDDGAEPDAPDGRAPASASAAEPLDLVLDFQPNAVHSGIYAAAQNGGDVDLHIQAPGASTDAPKLLRAGRTDLAILDIHDLAIAREQGAHLIAIAAIVQRPLAAVIAADGSAIRDPADLAGKRIGVTGLPSDDAVLETVLAAGGLGLDDVDTVTVGFDAVPLMLAGKLDAATAFWNAEGVTLANRLDTREFRVDEFGAPAYPELLLVTNPETLNSKREAIEAAVAEIDAGYAEVEADPEHGLDALIEAVPELDRDQQQAQLQAVLPAFGENRALDSGALFEAGRWEVEHGIVDEPFDFEEAFDFDVAPGGRGLCDGDRDRQGC